jgi:hypothetical protein
MTIPSEHKGGGLFNNAWAQPVLFTAVILILIALCWRYVW